MKKAGVIPIFLLVLILIVQIAGVCAQDASDLSAFENDPLIGTVQTGTEKATQFQEAENKSDFLKTQWGELLAKHAVLGPIIRAVDKASPVTNPLFRYTVGMEPSLTWLFIITLILFIIFISYLNAALGYSTFSGRTRAIISLCLTVMLGVAQTFVRIASTIISVLTAITSTWWGQLIAIAAVIITAVMTMILSKNFEKIMKGLREKREKEKLESDVKEVKTEVGVQKETQKSITETFSDEGRTTKDEF